MGVILNMFEEEKYKVIKAVSNNQTTKERAELKLDLSRDKYIDFFFYLQEFNFQIN